MVDETPAAVRGGDPDSSIGQETLPTLHEILNSPWPEAVSGVTINLAPTAPALGRRNRHWDAVLLMRIAKRRLLTGSNLSEEPRSSGLMWPSGAGLRDDAVRFHLAFQVIRLETKRQPAFHSSSSHAGCGDGFTVFVFL